ncbi:hypothetical protein IU459_29495 [Nocardia amamiensis]|uniref:Uncharacterized protein n=1 Tax=Nocardia amamiensis TaxID=404578 RepID=A0ABS0CYF9_9NOCA|nr:hypothetical protein [Nocardia amamiensis]MBF6301643.1 hypothetical protein [Nocardia amamiensis]
MSTAVRTVAELMIDLARSDGLDDAVTAYYANRVQDPQEALWRTDYALAYIRWDKAEDAPWRDHPRAIELQAQARAIEQRWAADPIVGPRWAELDQLRSEGDYAVPIGDEEPTMQVEAPPGMDPITWRSHLQANDMTGHGRWPASHTAEVVQERQALIPGHAFAGLVNGRNRGQEMER